MKQNRKFNEKSYVYNIVYCIHNRWNEETLNKLDELKENNFCVIEYRYEVIFVRTFTANL